ncbi:uncharacterized protein LACBIDRAFT_334020 [Laccaria bicolor S238N-H82]|uniref:Predicted protein n=1 Tax=Laccaria bicolor (strain S238N-H82 / ATCC MYA-4686) TaxID=486041 RepID=B0DXU1_LACBS|nr:uncharacterized protein LACBIDRAFT_334020 [Laccaria bicolor S238N-H82]EDR00572.1 predicted protein [Laccaria bicolor S238N-H82]|eukprot:XP_001888799.1 predicted protein [Laccaria bicolor S238N-H82]
MRLSQYPPMTVVALFLSPDVFYPFPEPSVSFWRIEFRKESPRKISKTSVCDHSEDATRSERIMKDMGDIVKFLTLFKTLWHLSLVIGELCARNIEQPATLFALRAAFLGAGIPLGSVTIYTYPRRKAIDPEIVRKTWDGVPHDEQGLPDNWISESGVLVGMRGRN